MTTEEIERTEIISPEGLDERVLEVHIGRITLTQGGKHRVYFEARGAGQEQRGPTINHVSDSLEAAQKQLAQIMLVRAGLTLDEKKTLDHVIDAIASTKRPK